MKEDMQFVAERSAWCGAGEAKSMKREYVVPEVEILDVQQEISLLVGSKEDQYSIGSGDSQWPQDGPIHDDYGDGPGVSGAKQNGQHRYWGGVESWED